MKIPDICKTELACIKKLRSQNVLDTPSKERFDRLTRLAKHMFNVPIAVVSIVDENRQWFNSCLGLDISETPLDISFFCGHDILKTEVVIVSDTKKDPLFSINQLVLNEPHIRFYAGCPLRHLDGSILGTLCILDTNPKILEKDDLESLKDLAELAEHELMAIQLATIDELTKIFNRRGFIKQAEQSLYICARHNIATSLVFFDLNDFKSINDNFGHAEGDIALIAFSEQIKNTFRSSDVLARLGGDEFVVLLTDTSIDPVEKSIARLQLAIECYNKAANRGYNLSFSDGIVAIDHKKNISIELLLSQADSLMYEKKCVRRSVNKHIEECDTA